MKGHKHGIFTGDRTENGLRRIIEAYEQYAAIDKFAYRATQDEIAAHDFNLNIPRYVDTFEAEPPVDMEAVQQNIYRVETELRVVKEKMTELIEQLCGAWASDQSLPAIFDDIAQQRKRITRKTSNILTG